MFEDLFVERETSDKTPMVSILESTLGRFKQMNSTLG